MAYEQLSLASVTGQDGTSRVVAVEHDEWQEASAPVQCRSWRAVLAAGAIALGGASALAVKKASTPCVGLAMNRDSIVSLAAVESEEMSKYADATEDPDAVKKWLNLASEVSAEGNADLDHARKVIDEAMKETDPEAAQKAVQDAMDRNLKNWDGKRRDLKSYLKKHSRNLKHQVFRKRSPATTAECVFNVEQAVTQVAALAANIADSVKTCQNLPGVDWKSTNGKVCVVNLAGIGYSVSMIAASLSLAADNCASTFFPNYDALCAGAATGIAASVSQFSGAAALTSAACMPEQLNSAHPGVVPSNFGQSPGMSERRLVEAVNGTAQARRLLFGGGQGATATQCYVDTTSVAWWLAQAGLAINAAVNVKDQATCRLPFIKHGKMYKYAQLACAVDALGAVNGFLQVIQYLQFAVVHCSDSLNLQAMCGAGIDGMISALTGISASGLTTYLNCWEAQGLEFGRNKALQKLHRAAMMTKVNGLRQEGNYGRRLTAEDLDRELDELKSKFATPEDAWRSIGVDLDDRDAAFRSVPNAVNQKDLVKLMESPTAKAGHLFEMCS